MLPSDYEQRVYAGWLGKCIGVRFGAPVEGWTYDDIRNNIGELTGYLREDAGKVFKPDDDTAVPMILIRAFEDYGISPDLSAEQIAETWLNYLGDQHGTLWWGGYGVSTEHTAYLNLVNGIPAPRSGSVEQNGATVAEQIGGQIFSDIWGLVAPNQPALAAALAERASSVTHGGNGIYGGRFVAALVSAAFGERDPRRLIEIGLEQVPADSTYARVIRAMLEFHAQTPDDWHAAYQHLKAHFGYDKYGGVVHIIPNAGVVALALLYGAGDFSRTIQIANMCGWDTDCNVGNVGAVIGVANGVEGIDAAWREPINDLLVTASVIGTRNLLTIPPCADLFSRIGRVLAGETAAPPRPRYHFDYSGSISNFEVRNAGGRAIELRQRSGIAGRNALQVAIRNLNKKGEVRVFTRTYYRPKELSGNYYGATLTPLIHPGQRVRASVYVAPETEQPLHAGLYVYDDNHGQAHQATAVELSSGTWTALEFDIPPLDDACLSEVGIVLRNTGIPLESGALYVGDLDWSGVPSYTTTFARERPESGCISQWSWLRGYWRLEDGAFHGSGTGECEAYTGDIAWDDYTLTVDLVPVIGEHHAVNTRVHGTRHSYAFGLAPNGQVALYRKDGAYQQVAAAPFAWQHGKAYHLQVQAQGALLTATVTDGDQTAALRWTDDAAPYLHGQIGLSTWYGSHTRYLKVAVSPNG